MSMTSPVGVWNATLPGGAHTRTRTCPVSILRRCRVPCVERSVTLDPPSNRIVPIRATSTRARPDAGTSSVPPTASCDDADDDGPETLHGRPEGHVNLHCENPM